MPGGERLVALALSATVLTVSADSTNFDCFEAGVDYPGNDILDVAHMPTAIQCQRLCAYYPGCVFFAYGREGTYNERCWLKSAKGRQYQNPERLVLWLYLKKQVAQNNFVIVMCIFVGTMSLKLLKFFGIFLQSPNVELQEQLYVVIF